MGENWKEDIISGKLGGKSDWTDEERLELCHQLDKDLDKHIDKMDKKKFKDGWTEDNWKEKMGEHPLFAPYVVDGKDQGEAPLNDLSEGLAQLKYDPEHNTPSEVAQNYKEEGVYYFKLKKYRFVIASFTEGIKQKCLDDQLNSQLYNNRAASHFYLGNYRSALNDCDKAISLKPDYCKAIQRAIECAVRLQSWNEAISWCDKGLLLNSDNEEFLKQRTQATLQKKKADRDIRKEDIKTKAKLMAEKVLLNAISTRGITMNKIVNDEEEKNIVIADLEPVHLNAKNSPVHLDAEGALVWPVLFLYPEYNESDCVLEFHENSCFYDHLELMFGSAEPPAPWDKQHTYITSNLALYFENQFNNQLISVDPSSSLSSVLSDKRYVVQGAVPGFIVLVKNSKFAKEFIEKYS